MNEIRISSYAKINLSIDVKGVLDSGMHEVDMIMQQISFHDDVNIIYEKNQKRAKGDIRIVLTTNKPYLPVDEKNTAYKAAALMIERYGRKVTGGTLKIDVLKRIPVAAGMAGGSGNGAAVLHGLNALWKLKLTLKELCELGSEIGSDVPFCIMGQAKNNYVLPAVIRKDPLAVSCARATGTGTTMVPVQGIKSFLVIAKPSISVSTKRVYQGIDSCVITKRPDNAQLITDLENRNAAGIYENCINVLEEYTLKAYPEVGKLKERIKKFKSCPLVLMSGSGPTVFALCKNINEARELSRELRSQGYEAYWTKTTK